MTDMPETFETFSRIWIAENIGSLGSQTDPTNLKYILRVTADELEKAATTKGFYGELAEAVRPYGGIEGYVQHQFEETIEARNPSGSLYAPRACFKETQRAQQVRAIKCVFKNQKPECTSSDTRRRWDVLMNRKFIVAVLLVVAAPVYAQAQNPRVSKGDAQKVGTIISGDKIKTQAYCDIQKLAEQVAEANEKKDSEKVNRLFDKIETLEKSLGLEYVALINGIQVIAENDELRAEFLSAFGALARLCTR